MTARGERNRAQFRNENANIGQLIYEVQQLREEQQRTNELLARMAGLGPAVASPLPGSPPPAPPRERGGTHRI